MNLKREADIGVEGFQIGMSDPQHHRVLPMELDAGRHSLSHHFLLFLFSPSNTAHTISATHSLNFKTKGYKTSNVPNIEL